MKKKLQSLSLLIALSLLLAACLGGEPPAPTAEPDKNNFNPLPPPAYSTHNVALQQMGSVDPKSAQFQLLSPEIDVKYGQTALGVGGVEYEKVTLLETAISGTSITSKYGDWFGGQVSVAQYYGRGAQICGGNIELSVKELSILQLFTKAGVYPIDRSKLSLIYSNGCDATKPITLQKVVYSERYGTTSTDILAMGVTATWWSQTQQILPEQYQQWGFWENGEGAFDLVTQALEATKTSLSTTYTVPNLLVIDRDSLQEVIGRQTGFVVEKDGQPFGKITLTYNNTWGRAPNTNLIGTGALSRVEYELAGGETYYTILLLTPQISPVPSTLYIFSDDRTTADGIAASKQWVTLYPKLRAGIPHVFMAVHAIGDLKKITSSSTVSVTGKVDGSDVKSSGDVTFDLGSTGGIAFSTLGDPRWDDVILARELLNMLGESGMRALGFYFPSEPGSGSGLDYYLSTTSLTLTPKEVALNEWNKDVGYIDRKGIVDLSVILRGVVPPTPVLTAKPTETPVETP
ncbi:MAG TPA: hypothetical protein VJ246_01395 [Patescibacteria group bacterium]|nr:hypothetical protein [Patescibacteria group bacterium]